MDDKWFYRTSDGTQFGPIPFGHLTTLATTGEIRPNDLVWQQGSEVRLPARRIDGLFPQLSIGDKAAVPSSDRWPPTPTANVVPPKRVATGVPPTNVEIADETSTNSRASPRLAMPPSTVVPPSQSRSPGDSEPPPLPSIEDSNEPPPLPPVQPNSEPPPLPPHVASGVSPDGEVAEQNEVDPESLDFLQASRKPSGSKGRKQGSSFVTTAKMAGQLIAKNAEKARLLNITLPGLFHALGKRLFEAKSFQNELADIWSIIDELLRQLKSLRSPTVAQTTQQGIADRAKQAAIRAGDAAQAKLIEAKLSSAITKLGTIAYELYGQQAGEPELMQPIKDAQNKVAALDSDILSLGTSTKGGWLTPKRLIVGGVAAVCLIGVMLMSVGGPTHSTDESEQEKNVRWGESVRDSREIAEESDLEGLGFAKIIDLLGNPDEVFRSRRSPNVGLAIWQTGSNEYTVVGFIESIDGHSPTLVLSTAQKRSPSIVEKLKATVDGF